MKVTQLRVYPNVYACIHRLQGAVDGVTWAGLFPVYSAAEAGVHGQIVRYVGANAIPYNKEEAEKHPDDAQTTRLVSAESLLTVKGQTAVTGYAQYDVAYKYDPEATVLQIPANDPDCLTYYARAIAQNDWTGHSSLIAADLETARICGIGKVEYKDPLVLLEEFRTEAIKRFAASNSDITVEDLEQRLPHVFTAQKIQAAKKPAAPSQATTGGQS
jgi:hypothetical protein